MNSLVFYSRIDSMELLKLENRTELMASSNSKPTSDDIGVFQTLGRNICTRHTHAVEIMSALINSGHTQTTSS